MTDQLSSPGACTFSTTGLSLSMRGEYWHHFLAWCFLWISRILILWKQGITLNTSRIATSPDSIQRSNLYQHTLIDEALRCYTDHRCSSLQIIFSRHKGMLVWKKTKGLIFTFTAFVPRMSYCSTWYQPWKKQIAWSLVQTLNSPRVFLQNPLFEFFQWKWNCKIMAHFDICQNMIRIWFLYLFCGINE